jgi:TolB-like protein/tetratricopeptide (TPR) repeat protein
MVLPFVDLSPSKDSQYLGPGFAEEITNRLTKVPQLRVLGNVSAQALSTQANPSKVAARQNISTLVAGSILVQRERVRVTARLVNTADERSLWSRSWEGRLDEIFRIQDEIAIAVCGMLQKAVSSRAPAAAGRTTSIWVYNRYLQGVYVARTVTALSVAEAMRIQQEVVRVDPGFAPAWSSLAHLSSLQFGFFGGDLKEVQTARSWAAKSIQLDPDRPEPYCALGHIAMIQTRWTEAEGALRKALELAPGSAFAHELHAIYLMTRGRVAESLEEIEIACQLDPLSLITHRNRGNLLFHARRYEDALEALREARQLDPNFPWTWATEARVHLQMGHCEEALAASERAVALLGQDHFSRPLAIVRCRPEREGRAATAEFARTRGHEGASVFVTSLYAALGERDRALQELEKAVTVPTTWLGYLKADPELDSLRSDPRFTKVLAKVGMN